MSTPAEDAPLMIPESIRSKAWAAAKPVALAEWGKGSPDTTQMLMACSRAVDAALAAVIGAEGTEAGS